MRNTRWITFVMIAILLSSAFSVTLQSSGAEDQYVDEITIEVRTSITAGLDDTATGDMDMFLHPVSGKRYESISDSWKSQMRTTSTVASYNNLLFNPAHDPAARS